MSGDLGRIDAESMSALFLSELATLQSPRSRKLPPRVMRVLPDPARSLEEFERFSGADVARLNEVEVHHEMARLGIAVASIADLRDVPPWIWARRRLLAAQLHSVNAVDAA